MRPLRPSQSEIVYQALDPPPGTTEAQLRQMCRDRMLDEEETAQMVRLWWKEACETVNPFTNRWK